MTTVYNPSKKYSWMPEDKFELTGDQFGTVLNALRAIMGTPETQRTLALARANDVFETLMAKSVEEGTVIEVPEPPKNGDATLKIVKK